MTESTELIKRSMGDDVDDVLASMDAPDDREDGGKIRDILDLKTPYAPTPHEERLLGQHEDKKAKQPPKLRVSKGPGRYFAIVPDHADEKIGTVATMQSIGTNDPDFFNAISGELVNLIAKDGSVDERRLASAFALVQAVEPANGVEGMLAAQMCAVHMESMKMAARLARTESQEMADIALPAFNKLARTFVMQVEALKRLRSTGEQIVRHQYVHVSDGGQAVVGDVFPQEGGALKRVEQSRLDYAPGVEIEEGRRAGAPRGNVNAMKSGRWSADTLAERKEACAIVRQARKTLAEIK